MSELKPYADACDRNRGPILEVLRRHFADRRRVLEIGSGTGQHAVYFASALPHLTWQTSDREEHLAGIRLWLEEAQLPNTPAPLALDVSGAWPEARFDALFSANTLHIMSSDEVQRLFAALPGVMSADAILAVYGPFNYGGAFTSPSNAAFDATLRRRSVKSGIRDFEAVDRLAQASGLKLLEDCAMPANNRTLVWQRTATAQLPA
jgi:cyclopropane fatty-acyl-phospholipid synthase-like methyltransferase